MDQMEQKLNSILSNPQMMQTILGLAQSLGDRQTDDRKEPESRNPEEQVLQQLSGVSSRTAPDSRQQALLTALGAYLSREKMDRLERALRGARMAKLAGLVLGDSGLPILTGR